VLFQTRPLRSHQFPLLSQRRFFHGETRGDQFAVPHQRRLHRALHREGGGAGIGRGGHRGERDGYFQNVLLLFHNRDGRQIVKPRRSAA